MQAHIRKHLDHLQRQADLKARVARDLRAAHEGRGRIVVHPPPTLEAVQRAEAEAEYAQQLVDDLTQALEKA